MLLIIMLATACNQRAEEHVSTDIVNNPQTASGEVDMSELPVMEFEEEVFNFGEITQGEKVNHSYKFKNTGKTDLVITSARGSCGCTVPTWPKKPIAVGEEGIIEVVFNSEGKKGQQNKKVTIVANTQPSTNVVAIKGIVIAPEKEK
ncbi:MAG: hypothetical protein COA57_13570 [Flavobacteriales bacterium]|nr:MAG: hypothetical protein COA57_13570 [Flavobacteriales bacterium]